jgi:hypothetical protein
MRNTSEDSIYRYIGDSSSASTVDTSRSSVSPDNLANITRDSVMIVQNFPSNISLTPIPLAPTLDRYEIVSPDMSDDYPDERSQDKAGENK